MKFGVVNKSTILNRFVLHTLQRNITQLAVITRKTNIKLGILKGGNWKRALLATVLFIVTNFDENRMFMISVVFLFILRKNLELIQILEYISAGWLFYSEHFY